MRVRLKINYGEWLNSTNLAGGAFTNVTLIQSSISDPYQYSTLFVMGRTNENYFIMDDELEVTKDNYLAIIGEWAIIEADISTIKSLINPIKYGFIDIETNGKTSLMLFKLNSTRNHVVKTLIDVGLLYGEFKAPLGIKNIEIDVEGYDINNTYNYVYLPVLQRYYYVTNIQFINKKFTRLILLEDVLYSHSDLIKSQDAYVTRYSGATDKYIVDDRYPVEDVPTYTYFPTIVNVSGASTVSFKFAMSKITGTNEYAPNVFISTVSKTVEPASASDDIEPPTHSGLPYIQSRRGYAQQYRLLNLSDYASLVNACISNDAPASYIRSALLLPFDLRDIFPDTTKTYKLRAGEKWLINAEWGDDPSLANLYYGTTKGGCPYIVIKDFYFDSRGGITIDPTYLGTSPNTIWEMYLPFVGWVQINAKQMMSKRIVIYYTFDLDTGISTAYIYNFTNAQVLYSFNCQIGMKLPLTTTNAEELARQKQATGLNLAMGILSSTISLGIGGATGNPLALVGGVMGLGKTGISAVNSFNSMIEKAQTTYGTPDNALYANDQIYIRKITHAEILTTTAEQNKFKDLNGYPYKKCVTLSTLITEFPDYVEVGDINFDPKGNNIYSDEITEIVALLKKGVIF